ncbi:MAG: hypothetical protein HOO06_05150 [Bdellovibrionaceae bacterium]|nr:hypothetical protein [Pseudobdellovibrionaceae bacterium]
MSNTILKIITLISLLVLSDFALAKDIYYGSGIETVKLVYGQPTIFRFHKQVRTISQIHRFDIQPADQNDPDYSVLTVKPRFTKGTSKAVFILSDGSPVNVKLVMASKSYKKSEAFYDFKPKSQLIERGSDNSNLPVVTEIELMKAMIRDDLVTEYKKKNLNKWINSHFEKVSVYLKRIYTGKEYNGYVFTIINNRRYSGISIDIKKLILGDPNLAVLSQIDDEFLPQRKKKSKSTTLRIVAKSSATYGNVTLPITIVKPKKKSKKGGK